MKTRPERLVQAHAYTVAELLVATGVGVLLLGLVAVGCVGILRSIYASDGFSFSANNADRLIDYLAQDLRRSVAVAQDSSGALSPLVNNQSCSVTETTALVLDLPDYYGSNTPNADPSSTYRNSRYPRSDLNTSSKYNGNGARELNGVVYWKEAITVIGTTPNVRFAPAVAGTGLIRVRYYQAARSSADRKRCYFRSESSPGSNTPLDIPREIAEVDLYKASAGDLTITCANLPLADPYYGRVLTVATTFPLRYQRIATAAPTRQQALSITLRNKRRDL